MADFPLQGSFLTEAKNRNTALGKTWWPIALPAHAFIHGMGVAVITGSTLLGACEVIAHAMIDYAKCENRIGIVADQALHILCKAAYVVALFLLGVQMTVREEAWRASVGAK